VQKLTEIDEELAKNEPISSTNSAISNKHKAMLGAVLAQTLNLDLTSSDFNRFAARVGMVVGGRDVEQNGLGFNNLIYMAVAAADSDSASVAVGYCSGAGGSASVMTATGICIAFSPNSGRNASKLRPSVLMTLMECLRRS